MKLNLIFTVHNHQPIGNFDFVFEEVYQKSYLPFIEVLEKFPDVKITQHYTGILLKWLQKAHPEFIERIKKLVENGQIELLGGAYYEAILSIIPPDDRILQLKKLSEFIEKLFNFKPQGMWLAERVWEQQIVKEITQADLKFLPIDEAHFFYSGFKENELLGYYITEEQGFPLYIFPGSKKLRYTIPFATVDENIEWLKSLRSEEGNLIVFADDGEKFGSWPGTFEHVFKNKWLETFFSKLLENKEWLETIHFSDAIKKFKPKGIAYLPTASYPEMLKWVLKPDVSEEFDNFESKILNSELAQYSSFVRSGYWRNFFAKYPEANWIHKRMLRVSKKVNESISSQKETAQNYLLAAQCNDAYWHGVFGGLYLPNLRFPIYQNLIKAESILQNTQLYQILDFDCDGKNEIIVENQFYNLYIKPDKGGAIYEMDYKPVGINFLDIINRKEETSHKKLLKKIKSNLATPDEIELSKSLIYDLYQHGSLIDHFFEQSTNPDNIYNASQKELGNFLNEEYDYKVNLKENLILIQLCKEGFIDNKKIKLTKTIVTSNDSSTLMFKYKFENLQNTAVNLKFGVEFVFNLLAGDSPDRYYLADGVNINDHRLVSIGVLQNIRKLSIVDEWLKLRIDIEAENAFEFWRLPIETISISESGYEKLYQGSIVIPIWDITLKDKWETTILQKIKTI